MAQIKMEGTDEQRKLASRLGELVSDHGPEACTIAVQGGGEHFLVMLRRDAPGGGVFWEAAGAADAIVERFSQWLQCEYCKARAKLHIDGAGVLLLCQRDAGHSFRIAERSI